MVLLLCFYGDFIKTINLFLGDFRQNRLFVSEMRYWKGYFDKNIWKTTSSDVDQEIAKKCLFEQRRFVFSWRSQAQLLSHQNF